MTPLDARKIRILQAVVQDFVDTSRPVGSERLLEVYDLGCKSATVRYEMAEMSEMGYLAQPHTSSGRIPTDRGYRYFVNELMEPPGSLPKEDEKRAKADLNKSANEIDEILQQTCRILSSLTSYASVATDPVTDTTRLRRLYLTQASPRHVLAVALFSTGAVEHRLVEVASAPADSVLLPLSNLLNEQVAGQSIEEIDRLMGGIVLPAEIADLMPTLTRVCSALVQLVNGLLQRRVYLQGANHLMRQPEFQDVLRLEVLLTALEQRNALFRVLRQSLSGVGVTIHIGTENPYEPMRECTLITRPYNIGDRHAGYLGVVGPTRMHYQRTISAVNFMSASLSTMLTSMCVD
jgi:heat-inducible transcriptional repressor